VLEHTDRPRPWLICIPGYRMGHPMIDFTGFPAGWFHVRRGLNVVIPVMPLHGPRKAGRRSGDGFLSGDYIDTLHLQAQAVWDVRRIVAWLRARGAGPIGLYGVSLGGYTAALVSALEDDLACVIAGMPATCYVGLARSNLPGFLLQVGERLGIPWEVVEKAARVISPLAFVPRVPAARRFLFAGAVDRLVSPRDVTALWRHWDRPRLAWYDGGHVSFRWERTVRALLHEALETSGLVAG
jgi:dienelactone hydrolase